jgi:fumarylacetoacetate (FAA) hydrolase
MSDMVIGADSGGAPAPSALQERPSGKPPSNSACRANTAIHTKAAARKLGHADKRSVDGGVRGSAPESGLGIGFATQKPSVRQTTGENVPMKLATYQDGSRDGQLVVVSRDLTQAHYATHIANRLQQVLDDWNYLSPQLQDLYTQLNQGRARHAFPFDPAQCMAPLPRAYRMLEGQAYLAHEELAHRARGATWPDAKRPTPELFECASDDLLGPRHPIPCANEAWGLDFSAQLAVVTGDVPAASAADRALDSVRLLALVNAVSLRQWPQESFGSQVHRRPFTALSPVVVTPDVLGEAWARGRVHLPVQCTWNGRKVGLCEAGADMDFHFGQLIAHAAATRPIRSGTLLASGPVCNQGVARKNSMDWPQGYSCIADKRAMEILQDGHATTEFLKHGDTIRIEVKGRDGASVFGAIEQTVTGV